MTVYTAPIATAQRLLTKYGAAAVLTRTVPGAYDPATGTTGSATVTVYTGVAFPAEIALLDIPGTLIKRGDVTLLLGPEDSAGASMVTPATDTDTVLFEGVTYSVIGVKPVGLPSEAVLFYVQCRGV